MSVNLAPEKISRVLGILEMYIQQKQASSALFDNKPEFSVSPSASQIHTMAKREQPGQGVPSRTEAKPCWKQTPSADLLQIPYPPSGPSIISMPLQCRDKDTLWDSAKCFE